MDQGLTPTFPQSYDILLNKLICIKFSEIDSRDWLNILKINSAARVTVVIDQNITRYTQ